MGIDYQTLEMADFGGGITDHPVDCPPNRYAWADNFVVTENAKLRVRPGSRVWDYDGTLSSPQLPVGAAAIRNLFVLTPGTVDAGSTQSPTDDPLLLAHYGRKIYYPEFKWASFIYDAYDIAAPADPVSPEWKEVFGINGNSVVTEGDANTKLSGVFYNYKLYLTQTNSPEPREPFSIFTEIRTFKSGTTVTVLDQRVVSEHYGLPQPILNWWDNAGTMDTAKLPTSLIGSGTTHTYIFAFVYARTAYFGPNIASVMLSEPYYVEVGLTAAIETGPFPGITFPKASFPTIDKSTLNKQTGKGYTSPANLYPTNTRDWIIVYRTKDGGTTPLYCGTWDGQYDFSNAMSDAALETVSEAQGSISEVISLPPPTGGTVTIEVPGIPPLLPTPGTMAEDGVPPRARYIAQCNDRMYYGNCAKPFKNLGSKSDVTSTGCTIVLALEARPADEVEFASSRVYQSKDGSPWSVPGSNFWDAPEPITGLGAFNVIPLAFTHNKTYRIDGAFDDLGRGQMIGQEISAASGCIAHNSIVVARDGLYFAGKDGFYVTDGYQVSRISDFTDYYQKIIAGAEYIQGSFDSVKNRVLWSVRYDGATENNMVFVLNLNQKIRGLFPFTTWSGSEYFTPTTFCWLNGIMVRGSTNGYVYYHDDTLLGDIQYKEMVSPAAWLISAVKYDYQGPTLSIAGTAKRQWVPKVLLSMDSDTDLSVEVGSKNDKRGAFKSLKEIRLRNRVPGITEKWRWFPAKGIRCAYKQVQIKNANTVITNSDTLGTATVNAVAQTALLDVASFPSTVGKQEALSGLVNGVNKTFVMANDPLPGSVLIFVDDLCLLPYEYSITNATVTLTVAPTPTQTVYAFYIDILTDPDVGAISEIPVGLLDGVNRVYELTEAPAPVESLLVFVNGRLSTAWTLSGSTLTFDEPLAVDQTLSVYYFTNSANEMRFVTEIPVGLTDGVNASFQLTYAQSGQDSLLVFVNGVLTKTTDWDVASKTLTFDTAPEAGSEVEVAYLYTLNIWPRDIIGFSIYFEQDGYTVGFEITNVSDDTVTFIGPEGLAPTGSQKFVVRGYPADERFELLSYVLYWLQGEDTQASYAKGEDGANQ